MADVPSIGGTNIIELRDGPLGRGVQRVFMVFSCPGCWKWQLDISTWAALDLGGLDGANAVIDAEIISHVAHECDSPRLIMELARNRGLL